jgi:hypothetical protein
MQKATLAMLVFLSCTSMALAQPAPTAAAVKPAPMAVKMFAGKIDTIAMADPAKNTKASIVVIDEKQLKELFIVTPATVITDAADKAIAFGALASGEMIKVAFVSKDAVREAIAIRIQK